MERETKWQTIGDGLGKLEVSSGRNYAHLHQGIIWAMRWRDILSGGLAAEETGREGRRKMDCVEQKRLLLPS